MTFRYSIVGRNNSFPGEETYSGDCEAGMPRDAFLKALATELGDPAYGPDPLAQLCDSDWISRDELHQCYGLLDDKDSMLTLHAGEHTFFVSVTPLT